MRISIPKLAVALILSLGVAVVTLILVRSPVAHQITVSQLQVACAASNEKQWAACGHHGSVIRLGRIIVTPTLAQQRYAASHDIREPNQVTG
ncbi:MAG: hypothetical protein ACYDCJ_01205 [Gammaproteobacteria bacterium]